MTQSRDIAALVGRVLLAFLFVYSGFGKIGGFEGTAAIDRQQERAAARNCDDDRDRDRDSSEA